MAISIPRRYGMICTSDNKLAQKNIDTVWKLNSQQGLIREVLPDLISIVLIDEQGN